MMEENGEGDSRCCATEADSLWLENFRSGAEHGAARRLFEMQKDGEMAPRSKGSTSQFEPIQSDQEEWRLLSFFYCRGWRGSRGKEEQSGAGKGKLSTRQQERQRQRKGRQTGNLQEKCIILTSLGRWSLHERYFLCVCICARVTVAKNRLFRLQIMINRLCVHIRLDKWCVGRQT